VPFSIKVDNINEIYVTKLRQELTGADGLNPRAYDAAAQFCAQAGTHLEDALSWADLAIKLPTVGQTNFDTLSTKALVLSKMGREPEAKEVMQAAIHLPSATSFEIHQYGRQLLAAKKNQEALEVFKLNAERNGDAWPVNVGLARAYMALGDYKKAAEYAQKAAAQAPDVANKKNLEAMAQTLAEGKPYAN
jgi:tetratricopeptide (TPR) repeat protein